MATYTIRDLRKFRFLPIKQVVLKSSANNYYVFGEFQEGAAMSFEPITQKDSGGADITIAYSVKLNFTLTQNDFDEQSAYYSDIANERSWKGFSVTFNDNMTINSAPMGELLYFINYDDEASYHYYTDVKLSYSYINEIPLISFEINSLVSNSEAINLWKQSNWTTYTW